MVKKRRGRQRKKHPPECTLTRWGIGNGELVNALARRKQMSDLYQNSELADLFSRWKNQKISLDDFQGEIERVYLLNKDARQKKEAKRITRGTGIEEQLSIIEEISIIDNLWGFFIEDLEKSIENYPELQIIFEIVNFNYYDIIGLCPGSEIIRPQSPTIESGTLFTPFILTSFQKG